VNSKRLEEIRERLQPFISDDYSIIAQHKIETRKDRDVTGDVADLLAALAEGGGERCVKCGHDCGGDEQGCEAVVRESPLTFCGCRCEFTAPAPADGAAVKAACVERIKYKRDDWDQQSKRLKGAFADEYAAMRNAADYILDSLKSLSVAPVETSKSDYGQT